MNDPNITEGCESWSFDGKDEKQLLTLVEHREPCVRRRVALRLSARHLKKMMHDPDFAVRCIVARRLNPEDALLMSALERDPYVKRLAFCRAFDIEPNA